MSRLLFISNSGEALPIVYRLRQEGTDADIYIHNPKTVKCYAGIIDKVTISNLKTAVKKANIIVFDITRPNDRAPQDLRLLKMFGLKTSSPSVFGPVGDKLKKDRLVIGASEWSEDIELDRKLGSDVARKCGFEIPETAEFKSLRKGIAFLEAHKENKWVLKPNNNQDLHLTWCEKRPGQLVRRFKGDIAATTGGDSWDYTLQKKVEGVEMSNQMWFTKAGGMLNCSRTFEEKKLWTKNKSVSVGSMNNIVIMSKNPNGFLSEQFKKLSPYVQRAGYIGPGDVNTIISEEDHKAYFLEWTFRKGYDALYIELELNRDSLTTFFTNDFKVGFHDEIGASMRFSLPPYPYHVPQLLERFAKDAWIEAKLEDMPWFWAEDVYKNEFGLACAGTDGILGVVTARAETMWGAVDEVYRRCEWLDQRVGTDCQFRSDLGVAAEKRMRKLKKWGIDIG